VKIGLISFRPLLFFLPFSISFCFRWFRWFRFISFSFRWFRFVSFSLISFRFVSFSLISFRSGFDHHWTRILCIYSARVCPFHLVASFKFGNHKSKSSLLKAEFAKLHMGLVVLVKKMSVLINFLLQNTNLVSVLSKIWPNCAGHVWQDWRILRT
jgi:hypothetical protein